MHISYCSLSHAEQNNTKSSARENAIIKSGNIKKQKVPKTYNAKKTASLTNVVGKTGHLPAEN
jgi:hypothetical protein